MKKKIFTSSIHIPTFYKVHVPHTNKLRVSLRSRKQQRLLSVPSRTGRQKSRSRLDLGSRLGFGLKRLGLEILDLEPIPGTYTAEIIHSFVTLERLMRFLPIRALSPVTNHFSLSFTTSNHDENESQGQVNNSVTVKLTHEQSFPSD
jgi:hypothetical protein